MVLICIVKCQCTHAGNIAHSMNPLSFTSTPNTFSVIQTTKQPCYGVHQMHQHYTQHRYERLLFLNAIQMKAHIICTFCIINTATMYYIVYTITYQIAAGIRTVWDR